jgi:hypothetical protein
MKSLLSLIFFLHVALLHGAFTRPNEPKRIFKGTITLEAPGSLCEKDSDPAKVQAFFGGRIDQLLMPQKQLHQKGFLDAPPFNFQMPADDREIVANNAHQVSMLGRSLQDEYAEAKEFERNGDVDLAGVMRRDTEERHKRYENMSQDFRRREGGFSGIRFLSLGVEGWPDDTSFSGLGLEISEDPKMEIFSFTPLGLNSTPERDLWTWGEPAPSL